MKTTILKITRHRDLVRKNIHSFISKLEERSIMHDLSKFTEIEFDGFVEADEMSLYKEYGSSDYHKKLKENKGIKRHIENNTHHPEYWQIEPTTGVFLPDGHHHMPFLDMLEMVIDWKSASETYGNDFLKSIDYSLERFKFTPQQEWLIRLIAQSL